MFNGGKKDKKDKQCLDKAPHRKLKIKQHELL